MAPSSRCVYLTPSLRSLSVVERTGVLAHEMFHIRQYRNLGSKNFKCNYLKHLTECRMCQGERHPFEREAYAFESLAKQALAQYQPTLLLRNLPFTLPNP